MTSYLFLTGKESDKTGKSSNLLSISNGFLPANLSLDKLLHSHIYFSGISSEKTINKGVSVLKKSNCWEYKRCGREAGGSKVKELGICPASGEQRLHAIHDGENAGRACWVVAGTFCGGTVQGSFAKKFENCEQCDFYSTVRQEEGLKFKMSPMLLRQLRA